MTSAPRFWTRGMNSSRIHAVSSCSAAGPAADRGVAQVRVLGRGVVPPDRDPPDLGHRGPGLLRHLADGPVVIEAGHRAELPRREVRRVAHRDEGVRIGGVADHQHLHAAARVIVEGSALGTEDPSVLGEQVSPLHALPARLRADEHRVVGVPERDGRIVGDDDVLQQRIRAVVELHHHAPEHAERGGDLHQLQHHRRSGPSISPEAIRNSNEYPIWPAAPVTATFAGEVIAPISLVSCSPDLRQGDEDPFAGRRSAPPPEGQDVFRVYRAERCGTGPPRRQPRSFISV